MLKKDLRILYREKRKALTAAERNKLDDLLLINFQKIELPYISNLFSFWPIEKNGEPNVHLVTDYLAFKIPGLVIAYPRTGFGTNTMNAIVPGEDAEFLDAKFDLQEPATGEELPAASIEMVLVPLLAIDQKGYRVGYGKGFYDRFLAACDESCIKAGFSYFEPVAAIADTDEFDVPLDLCITPQNVYVF